ncbi:MAG: hypothetical protein IJ806_03705 [Ruminococcus sp.]|nr:hypothetical protein [Ruminococcus sp.]
MTGKQELSAYRLTAMMLMGRIFAAMTYFPAGYEGPGTLMAGTLLSALFQGLLMIPAAVLYRRGGREVSRGAAALYLIYFCYEMFMDIGGYVYFSDFLFGGEVRRTAVLGALVLSALFLAAMDTAVLGKAAGTVLIGMAAALLIIGAGAARKAYWVNIDFAAADPAGAVLRAAAAETARCECLVLYAFLLPRTSLSRRNSPGRTAAGFLAAKAVVLETVFFLTAAVLGRYFYHTKLPVFSAASYSGGRVIQRFDGLFLLIWCAAAIVKLGVLGACARDCIMILRPSAERNRAAALALLPCAVGAAVPVLRYRWESVVYGEPAALVFAAVVILTAGVPAAVLAGRALRRRTVSKGVRA